MTTSLARSAVAAPTPAGARPGAIEWPTCLLIVAVYAAWLLAAAAHSKLPAVVADALLVLATSWYMSLQHELLHGHPTPSRALNRCFALAPLAVWYPYDLYRAGHLAHHRDESLTQPGIDPESNYIEAADYTRLPRWRRPLWHVQRTVLGRMLVGPALLIVPTWLDIVRKPWRGDGSQARCWAQHLALLSAMFWALERWAGIGPLQYLLGVAYPALGLALLRSFYEHRQAEAPEHRIVVNEAGLFWRLLYLNNNYHAVHHRDPSMPWYRIRAAYLRERERVLERNGGFLIGGYGTLLRRHAWRPVDSPVHGSFRP